MEKGCERASYAPIVGSGINSTVLHYQRTAARLLMVTFSSSMRPASTRCTPPTLPDLPVNGHFTARQREIYNIVLGRSGRHRRLCGRQVKINDRDRRDPDSLDSAAYNYIDTHGKDLHGQPLGQYWLHGLGTWWYRRSRSAEYPALLTPGSVFTIEPGVYIPEEKLGVRIECVFLWGRTAN